MVWSVCSLVRVKHQHELVMFLKSKYNPLRGDRVIDKTTGGLGLFVFWNNRVSLVQWKTFFGLLGVSIQLCISYLLTYNYIFHSGLSAATSKEDVYQFIEWESST